jgi:hypothetical protein
MVKRLGVLLLAVAESFGAFVVSAQNGGGQIIRLDPALDAVLRILLAKELGWGKRPRSRSTSFPPFAGRRAFPEIVSKTSHLSQIRFPRLAAPSSQSTIASARSFLDI